MADFTDPVCGTSQLAARLRLFYDKETTKAVLVPLLKSQAVVSLRALDWLCTNASKRHNIVTRTKGGDLFNVYNGYKVTLSAYRRMLFDPFRRRDRHEFYVDGECYETTLGQVNFVYWAYAHGVLDYAYRNATRLEREMNSFSAAHKMRLKELRKRGIAHKRTSLSSVHVSKCHVYRVPHTVHMVTE